MSPLDSPTSHSRSFLGSSPLGQSQGTRISNEFSRFSNVSAIAQTLAADDIERKDAFDNISKYSSQSPSRRTNHDASFGHDGAASPTRAGAGSRVGRGVMRNPSRIFYRADMELDDDENYDNLQSNSQSDIPSGSLGAAHGGKQVSPESQRKMTSVCRICEKPVPLSELVAHSACCASSPLSSPRGDKHSRQRSMSPVDYLRTSSLSSSFEEKMRVSELSRSLSATLILRIEMTFSTMKEAVITLILATLSRRKHEYPWKISRCSSLFHRAPTVAFSWRKSELRRYIRYQSDKEKEIWCLETQSLA